MGTTSGTTSLAAPATDLAEEAKSFLHAVRLFTEATPGASRRTLDAIADTVRLFLPTLLGLAIGGAIHLVLTERGDYTDRFIAWGSADAGWLIERLLANFRSYLIGEGFVGGWVLLPTVAAAVLLFALAVVRSWRQGSWYPVLLLLFLLGLPFALSVALGAPLPNRAMQVLPLVAGSYLAAAHHPAATGPCRDDRAAGHGLAARPLAWPGRVALVPQRAGHI